MNDLFLKEDRSVCEGEQHLFDVPYYAASQLTGDSTGWTCRRERDQCWPGVSLAD